MNSLDKNRKIFSFHHMFALLALGLLLGSAHTRCQDMWIERNAKHIVAGGSVAIGLINFYINKKLGDQMFRLRPLADSDPFKKACLTQLSSMKIPDLETVAIKVSDDSLFEDNAQAKHREIVINQNDYNSYGQPDCDKDEIHFTVRHEGSHIKNNDYLKNMACLLGTFNACLYGTSWLMNLAGQKGFMPENTKLASIIKTLGPIAVAYKVAPLIANLYRAACEKRADKDAASDITLAKAGLRSCEKIYKEKQSKPDLRSDFVVRLISNPLIHRLVVGYETPEIRCNRLREYIKQFEKEQATRTQSS